MKRLFALSLLLSSLAWADVAPPNLAGCNGKSAGAACDRDDGTKGTCATGTCSRNDYSGGIPPKSVSYECLLCDEKVAPTSPPAEKKNSCASVSGEWLAGLALLFARRRKERS